MTHSVPSGFRTRRAPVEPGAGEAVVGGEIGELVPLILDAVDPAVVGPQQIARELEIIGRIGEDEIDRRLGQARHRRDAIADPDLAARIAAHKVLGRPPRTHSARGRLGGSISFESEA